MTEDKKKSCTIRVVFSLSLSELLEQCCMHQSRLDIVYYSLSNVPLSVLEHCFEMYSL